MLNIDQEKEKEWPDERSQVFSFSIHNNVIGGVLLTITWRCMVVAHTVVFHSGALSARQDVDGAADEVPGVTQSQLRVFLGIPHRN